MTALQSWLLIAIVFAALCLFWALVNFTLDHIARGIREFRDAERWP